MTTIIKKHWALIGFIAAFLLDNQFEFVAAIAPNATVANLIHGIGAIILAYFWQNENALKSASIGGGGIKNPKKP